MDTAPVLPDFRTLINGGNPDDRFAVPAADRFCRWASGSEDPIPATESDVAVGLKNNSLVEIQFLPAPEIEHIANLLLDARTCFEEIRRMRIQYRWKKTGGKRGGNNTLGMCVKPSGLLRHETEVDFFIWIAADNCECIKNWQMEALIFHELKHCDTKVNEETAAVTPAVRGHDWEGFVDELSHYGPWNRTIERIQTALHPTHSEQPNLFDGAGPAEAEGISEVEMILPNSEGSIKFSPEQLKAAASRLRAVGSTKDGGNAA